MATHQGHFDQAAERGQTALQLARSLGMQNHVATTLGNLAWNYSALGDYEAALEYFNQSAQESAKSGMSGRSAYWSGGVADAYMALRQYKQAEDLASANLKRARELKDSQIATASLNTLADIMLRTDRTAEAEKYNRQALELVGVGQDKFGAVDSWTTAGRIDTAKGDFTAAAEMYQRVLSDPNAGRSSAGPPTRASRAPGTPSRTIQKLRECFSNRLTRSSRPGNPLTKTQCA